jgi:hypothetical protein
MGNMSKEMVVAYREVCSVGITKTRQSVTVPGLKLIRAEYCPLTGDVRCCWRQVRTDCLSLWHGGDSLAVRWIHFQLYGNIRVIFDRAETNSPSGLEVVYQISPKFGIWFRHFIMLLEKPSLSCVRFTHSWNLSLSAGHGALSGRARKTIAAATTSNKLGNVHT